MQSALEQNSLPKMVTPASTTVWSRIKRGWAWLTEAPATITDDEERYRYRLLAGVMISTIGVAIVIILMALSRNIRYITNTDMLGAMIGVLIAIGMFVVLRRTHRINIVAVGSILLALVVTAIPPYMPDSRNTGIYFTLLPVIFTGMFFRPRHLLIWIVALPIFLYGIPPVFAVFGITAHNAETRAAVEVIIAIMLVMLVFVNEVQGLARARNQRLIQANDALRLSEASLEQRVINRTKEVEVAHRFSEKLYRISAAMNRTTTAMDIIKAISDEIESHAFSTSLILLEPAVTGQVQMGRIAAASTPSGVMAFDVVLPLGNVPQSNQEMLVIPDMRLGQDPVLRAFYEQMGIMAVAVASIFVEERVIGILSYTATTAYDFSEEDLNILRVSTQVAGAAIERQWRYAEQVQIAAQMRAVDAMKSQFLASMSHELRTPLNAILNFTEFVALGMMGEVNDRQRDALGKATESGRHLLSLINDVLDITKIESGMMQLFVEPNIDLYTELDAAKVAGLTLKHNKPIAYIEDIDPNLPNIVGDKRRIRQVLLNLVSNAVKFTDAGTITMSVKQRGDEILFAVSDTGPGIAKEDQAQIFEPFVQTEQGIQHAGGTGLGLPISTRLVEAHGGRLWLESIVGEGSTFYFTLPIRSETLVQQISA